MNLTSESSEDVCVRIFCRGCYNTVKYCCYIDHICNKCSASNVFCINFLLGCEVNLPKSQIKYHIENHCRFQIPNDLCGCGYRIPLRRWTDLPILSQNCLDHCQKCFKMNCKKVEHCEIVNCPNSCGFMMHKCKLKLHMTNICFNQIVPCICEKIGCTELMMRKNRGKHLKHCLASVVQCSFRWKRSNDESPIFKELLNSADKPRAVSNRAANVLLSACNKIYRKHFSQAISLSDELSLTDYFSKESSDIFSENRLNLTTGELGSQREEILNLIREAKRGQISPRVGNCFSFYNKNRDWIFYCSCIVPRSVFAEHMIGHAYLQMEFDNCNTNCAELVCPMIGQGCEFRVSRLKSLGNNNEFPKRISYHPLSRSFIIQSSEIIDPPTKDQDSSLLMLPTELIIQLMKYLDPFSLHQFRNTHSRFMEIWKMIYKPYVSLKWTKSPYSIIRGQTWKKAIQDIPPRLTAKPGYRLDDHKNERYNNSLRLMGDLFNLKFDGDSVAKMAKHFESCSFMADEIKYLQERKVQDSVRNRLNKGLLELFKTSKRVDHGDNLIP